MSFISEIFSRVILYQAQKRLINQTDKNTKFAQGKIDISQFDIEKWRQGYVSTPIADLLMYVLCIIGIVIADFSIKSIVMYGSVILICEAIAILSKIVRCKKEYVLLFSVLYSNPINDYINLLDKFILAFPKRKDFKTKKAEALLYSGEIKKALHYAECLNEKFPGSKYYQNFESKMKIVFLFLKNDDSYKSISFFPQKNDSEFEKLCFVIKNLDSVELRDTNLSTAETLYDSPLQFYKSIGALLLSRLYSVSDLDRAKECYDASVQYSLSEEMSMCINKYAQDLQSNDINEVDF